MKTELAKTPCLDRLGPGMATIRGLSRFADAVVERVVAAARSCVAERVLAWLCAVATVVTVCGCADLHVNVAPGKKLLADTRVTDLTVLYIPSAGDPYSPSMSRASEVWDKLLPALSRQTSPTFARHDVIAGAVVAANYPANLAQQHRFVLTVLLNEVWRGADGFGVQLQLFDAASRRPVWTSRAAIHNGGSISNADEAARRIVEEVAARMAIDGLLALEPAAAASGPT